MSSEIGKLRETLQSSTNKVANGDMSAANGRAIAWMACKYIAALKLELEYIKLRSEKPDIADLK